MFVSRSKLQTLLFTTLFSLAAIHLLFMFGRTHSGHRRTTELSYVSKDPVRGTDVRVKYEIQNHNARIFTKLNISRVGEIFPLDSRPPITLYRGFLIENAGLCASYLSLKYVVVVHSSPDHFERRQSLRETWAGIGALKGVNSRTIFVLGKCRDKAVQATIENENKAHRDIVQGDFYDDYKNLTLKAVIGLKWVVKNCRNAQYVVKTDDDVFVNIFKVDTTVFPILAVNEKQIVCLAKTKRYIFRPRNPNVVGKWEVSHKYFPKLTSYPMPFCYGFATFYTMSLANSLLKTVASTPFFRLDDVYIYGIVASKTDGVTWRDEGGRLSRNEQETLKLYLGKRFLVGTARSPRNMNRMWNDIKTKQHL